MGTLEKIVGACERLFMTYGIKSISMDDIATELGISKKTIYKHFSTKDRLIHITLSQYLRKEKRIVEKIISESDNAVEEMINIGRHIIQMARGLKPTLIFDLKKYHPKNWELIEKHHYDFIQKIIQQNLERGINEGYFRDNLNPEVIAKLYVGKNLIITDDRNFPPEFITRGNLLKEHLLYHLYGVLSEKGQKIIQEYEVDKI